MKFEYFTEDEVSQEMIQKMDADAVEFNDSLRSQLKGLTSSKLSRIMGKKIRDRADVQFFTNQLVLVRGHTAESYKGVTKIIVDIDDTFVEAWKLASPYTMLGKYGEQANEKLLYKMIKKAQKDYVKLCNEPE